MGSLSRNILSLKVSLVDKVVYIKQQRKRLCRGLYVDTRNSESSTSGKCNRDEEDEKIANIAIKLRLHGGTNK